MTEGHVDDNLDGSVYGNEVSTIPPASTVGPTGSNAGVTLGGVDLTSSADASVALSTRRSYALQQAVHYLRRRTRSWE